MPGGFVMAARCGLFGKIRPRRDFIAVDTPRSFLPIWEPWLQQGLATSRQALGPDWQSLYLTAPIWRFWLGADLCRSEMVGAIMPSIDGAGRCFPLTVMAGCDAGRGFESPDIDLLPEWFAAIEAFLLATLDDGATFESIKKSLGDLPVPAANVAGPGPLRGSSIWWTLGGVISGPTSFVAQGLPASEAMTAMIERGARLPIESDTDTEPLHGR